MNPSFKWELPYEWTGDWAWEGLAFTLYFARPITDGEEEQLRRLVLAWYEVGVWGGYGPPKAGKGVLHFLSEIVLKNDAGEPRVELSPELVPRDRRPSREARLRPPSRLLGGRAAVSSARPLPPLCCQVRRFLLLTLIALGVLAAAALPAGAAPSEAFYAQFQDDDCVTHAQCGAGLVEGYGHVITTLDLTGGDFDPTTGCLINVTAVRDVQLVGDPISTLTLDLFDGVICNNKGSAAFTISAATGAFAGVAVLPGTVRVTLITGIPRGDSAQYRATLAT